MVHIVKYSNNKMYSRQMNKYLKLSEIKELVQMGDKVQVIEYETENDITAHVLSQVLTITQNVNPETLMNLILHGK